MSALETKPDDEANKQSDAQCDADHNANNSTLADAI